MNASHAMISIIQMIMIIRMVMMMVIQRKLKKNKNLKIRSFLHFPINGPLSQVGTVMNMFSDNKGVQQSIQLHVFFFLRDGG